MPSPELSGLERIQACLDGRLPHPSMTDTLPMRITAADRGFVRFRARADARHLNAQGGVHGGFAATVLDSATGCAVHTLLEPGVGYATVDLSVKLVRAVPLDADVDAEGRVLHVSSRLGVAEAVLRDAAGTLLAQATATCLILRPRDGGGRA